MSGGPRSTEKDVNAIKCNDIFESAYTPPCLINAFSKPWFCTVEENDGHQYTTRLVSKMSLFCFKITLTSLSHISLKYNGIFLNKMRTFLEQNEAAIPRLSIEFCSKNDLIFI